MDCDESWFHIMNEKFPNLSQAFNFRRTDVVKTIVLLAGPFSDSNINRIYHKKIKVEFPFTGNRRPVNFFIDRILDLFLMTQAVAPLCAYLNQDSTASAIITQKNLFQELV